MTFEKELTAGVWTPVVSCDGSRICVADNDIYSYRYVCAAAVVNFPCTGGTCPGVPSGCTSPATPPAISASPSAAICSGTSTSLSVTGAPAAGVTWYWQTSASGTDQSMAYSGARSVTTAGTYHLRAYQSANGGCWSASTASLAVTVNSNPSVSTTSLTDQSFCGTSFTLSGTTGSGGSTVQWSEDQTAIIPGGASPSVTIATGTTRQYYHRSFNSTTGCFSAWSGPLSLTAVAAPSAPNEITNQTRCGNGMVTFTANDLGANYQVEWSIDNGATFPFTGYTFDRTISVGSPVSVRARVRNLLITNCVSTLTTARTGTASAIPSAPTGFDDVSRCGTGNLDFLADTPGPGLSLEWSTDGTTFGSPGPGFSVPSVAVGTPITVWARVTNGTCHSTAVSATGTADPIPSDPVAGSAQACAPGNITFTGTDPGTGFELRWGTDGATFASNGNTFVTTIAGPPVTVYVIKFDLATNCFSNIIPVTGSIVAAPAAPAGITSQTRCGNGTVTFTADDPGAGFEVVWSMDATTFSSPGLTFAPNVTIGSPVTVTAKVQQAGGGCEGPTVTVTGTAFANSPLPTGIANITRCGNGTVSFTANNPGAGLVVEWSADDITFGDPGLTSPAYAVTIGTPVTVYARTRRTTAPACASASVSVTGTAQAAPGSPVVGNEVRCGVGNVAFTAADPGAGFEVQWSTDDISFGTPGLTSPSYAVSVGTPITRYARVRSTASPFCTSTSISFTGTAHALPAAPTGVVNQSRCDDGSVTFTANDPGAGLEVQWSTDGVTFGSPGLTFAQAVAAGSPVTVHARVRNTGTACFGSSVSATGSVSSAPGVPGGIVNQARCGDGNVTFTANNPGAGLEVQWSTDGVTFGSPGLTFMTGITVGSPVTVHARVRNTTSTCASTAVTATGTATATPAAPAGVANQDRCADGNVTFTADDPGAGFEVQWGTDGVSFGTTGLAFPRTLVVGTPQTVYARVRSTAAPFCASTPVSVVGTAYADPAAPAGLANQQRCGNGTVTFSVNAPAAGLEAQWSTDGTTFGSPGLTFNQAVVVGSPVVVYVRLRNTTTGCVSTVLNATGTATANPSPPSGVLDQLFCGAGTITFTADNPGAGFVVEWSTDGLTFANPGLTSPGYAVAENTSITRYTRVRSTTTPFCESSVLTLAATSQPLPAAPTGIVNQTRCGNGTVTFTADNPGAGFAVEWSTNGGASFPDQGLTSPAYAVVVGSPLAVTARVRNTVTNCFSSTVNLTGTATALPAAPTGITNQTRCGNGTVTFTANNPGAGLEVQWSTDDVTFANPGLTSPAYAVTQAGGPVTVYARVRNTVSTCVSPSVSVTGTVIPEPASPNGLTGQVFCESGIIRFSANDPGPGIILQWSGDNGVTYAATGTTFDMSIDPGNSVTAHVRAYNTVTLCYSPHPHASVTYSPLLHPAPPTGLSPQTICGDGSVTFTADNPGAGYIVQWSDDNVTFGTPGLTSPVYNLTAGTTLTRYARVRHSTDPLCPSASVAVQATAHTLPGAPTGITDVEICGDGNLVFTATNPGAGLEVQWSTDGATFASPGATFTLSGVVAGSPYTVYARVRNTTTDCHSTPVTVAGRVYAIPAVPTGLANQQACHNSTVNFTANNPGAGFEVQWSIDGTTFGTPGLTSPAYTVDVAAPLTAYARVRNTTTGCVSAAVSAQGTAYSLLTAPTVNSPAICGAGTMNFTANDPGAGLEVQWSTDNLMFGTPGLTSPSYTVAAGSALTAYARVRNTATNCVSTATTLQATAHLIPATPAMPTGSPICNAGNATLTSSPGANGNLVQWSFDGATPEAATGNTFSVPLTSGQTRQVWARTVNTALTPVCESAWVGPVTVISHVPPATPAVPTGDLFVCEARTVAYTVPVVPAATGYGWNYPAGWAPVGATNGNTITLMTNGTGGDVSAFAIGDCGNSPAGPAASVLVFTTPSAVITPLFDTNRPQQAIGAPSVYVGRFNGNAGADVHLWELNAQVIGTGSTLSFPFEVGVHAVRYTATTVTPDGDQCTAQSSVLFTVTVEPQLLLPNAITPNNDGINDVLDFQVAGITEMSFKVYNRWGFQVFSQENSTRAWRGTDTNDQPLPEGIYTFFLTYRASLNGQQFQKQGTITIIR
ncbi:MAG: gliding motility-associated C-terminal domain-containing protein [Bacteroidetes bacterium]|nr:gliding motility-associated C-terminal domain-containing protein [Bacteroidota bacterium]